MMEEEEQQPQKNKRNFQVADGSIDPTQPDQQGAEEENVPSVMDYLRQTAISRRHSDDTRRQRRSHRRQRRSGVMPALEQTCNVLMDIHLRSSKTK